MNFMSPNLRSRLLCTVVQSDSRADMPDYLFLAPFLRFVKFSSPDSEGNPQSLTQDIIMGSNDSFFIVICIVPLNYCNSLDF